MENYRRHFLKTGLLGMAMVQMNRFTVAAPALTTRPIQDPKLDADLVKEFVGVCHGKFDRVKELYAKEPKLIFSSHDWGNGDFENGIEAAGHTGNREIANFLLEKGARINFFTVCMLGNLTLVKQMLDDFPFLLNAKGPHGFTPLHHANQGKEGSDKVRTFLISLGATETKISL